MTVDCTILAVGLQVFGLADPGTIAVSSTVDLLQAASIAAHKIGF